MSARVALRVHFHRKSFDVETLRRSGRLVLEFVIPAEPFGDAAAHDVLELLALQPRQLLSEEGDALAIAARHARDVGAPEEAFWSECVVDAMQAVLDVLERI